MRSLIVRNWRIGVHESRCWASAHLSAKFSGKKPSLHHKNVRCIKNTVIICRRSLKPPHSVTRTIKILLQQWYHSKLANMDFERKMVLQLFFLFFFQTFESWSAVGLRTSAAEPGFSQLQRVQARFKIGNCIFCMIQKKTEKGPMTVCV